MTEHEDPVIQAAVERFINDPRTLPCDTPGSRRVEYWRKGGCDGIPAYKQPHGVVHWVQHSNAGDPMFEGLTREEVMRERAAENPAGGGEQGGLLGTPNVED